MSKDKYEKKEWHDSMADLRSRARKYVNAWAEVLQQIGDTDTEGMVKEMSAMGYATGLMAGKLSDVGIEGFTLILVGISLSITGEDRVEKMQFAVWVKKGGLHTSEESFELKKGGEK